LPTDYAALLGTDPDEEARPTSVDEVRALVAEADASGRAIIPWGGGTGQLYGYLPIRADIVLSLQGLNRIVAHEPGDLTVTVQAGATLADVQKTLARHGQFLPLDPQDADGPATIGGILATNAWGPARGGYGTVRDWLIGLSLVDAAGRLVKGGGKVVKNVTGYDLPKLHVGALGTLGVLVEATFKVAPLPEASTTLAFRLPAPGTNGGGDAARPDEFVRCLHSGSAAPTLSVLHSGSLPPGLAALPATERYLFAVYHGTNEVIRSAKAAANRLADEHGLVPATTIPPHLEMLALAVESASGSSRLRVRLSGRPDSASVQHEALLRTFPVWEWVRTLPATGHTEAALRMGENPETVGRQIIEWARQRQTPVVLLKAPPALRAARPAADTSDDTLWWPRPPAFPLMKRLKETLDPRGTLNPGRFVGGI